MKRGTCNTCAFFEDVKKECRLNPPTVVNEVLSSISPKSSILSMWPKVDADDWCSGWQTALVLGVRKTYPHQINDGDVQFFSSTVEETDG